VLKIIEYIKEHGLDKTLEDFRLKSRDYPDKVLIKYNQIASPMAERVVQEARGIILEKGTWKVMSLPFYKFFNSAEGHAAKIDWNTARVLEKCDGTMIQLYYDWNKETWFAATTGTAEGEGEVNNKLGTTFNELFWNTVREKYGWTEETNKMKAKHALVKGYVYVFELTTPYNIVVKPHGESSVTLLTIRDMHNLEELPFGASRTIAKTLEVPMVNEYDLNKGNVGHLLKTFEEMAWHEEGYVVVDANFNRIKVKNPAYVAVHHLKSKTSEHAIIDVVKSNEIDEFVATFPERADEINKLKTNYDKLIIKLEGAWDSLRDKRPKNQTPKEKKKFAMEVFKMVGLRGLDSHKSMFFSLNDGKVDSVKDYIIKYDNKKLYKEL
jgi:hypothetical protein